MYMYVCIGMEFKYGLVIIIEGKCVSRFTLKAIAAADASRHHSKSA